MDKREQKDRVRRWSDKYQSKLERQFDIAFPELVQRIEESLEEASIKSVLSGGAAYFTEELLEPELEGWVDRHVRPVMKEASDELESLIQESLPDYEAPTTPDIGDEGVADPLVDVAAPVGTILAGVSSIIAGVMLGVGTWLWFFIAINWPILIGGIAVGTVLTAFGVVNAATVKSKFMKRLNKKIVPSIEDALKGDGYEDDDGNQQPSMKEQLQDAIHDAATEILKEL